MVCCPDIVHRRWWRVGAVVFLGATMLTFESVAIGAQVPPEGVVARLTAETKAEAVACGRSGPDCAITPYELCPRTSGYAARLVTPFSRVASAAYDDIRGMKPLGRMGPASVNKWGVAVSVSPAVDTPAPAAIERVEIRRAGQVIGALKAIVGPMAVRTAAGRVSESRRGFFVFPATAFDPSVDVDVVFVGSGRETVCHLDQAHLASLR